MRNTALRVGVVFLAASWLVACGSSGGTGTGGGAGGGAGSAPTVSTSGDVTTITGSAGGDVQLQLAAGPRLLVVKSTDGKLVMKGSEGIERWAYTTASLGSDHLYTQSLISKVAYSGTFTLSGANGPFTVTFTKLPTPESALSVPQTITLKGGLVSAPITLAAGNATVRVKVPDVSNATFHATVYDATTGTDILTGSAPAELADSYNFTTGMAMSSIDVTKTITIPSTGRYYFAAGATGTVSWEMDVSQ